MDARLFLCLNVVMKKFNARGFSTTEIIIGIAVLVLIGGAGIYVWDSRQKAKNVDYDQSLPFDEETDPPKPAKENEDGTTSVDFLVIGGGYFPTYQFKEAEADLCNANHWHAKEAKVYGLVSLDSNEIIGLADPQPSQCGFGKISEVTRESRKITKAQQQVILEYTLE